MTNDTLYSKTESIGPRCLFCRKGPMDGVSLYRINAKGEAGVWACARHKGQTDAKPDKATEDFVKILESRKL
jgi:hypothetical protein